MSLFKDKNGNIHSGKITLLCTIVVAVCAFIGVVPTLYAGFKEAISPWTSLPQRIDHIEVKVDKIAIALNVRPDLNTTNFNIAKSR